MRNVKTWNNRVRPAIISGLSPRLQRDLNEINYEGNPIPAFGGYYIYGGVRSGKTLLAAHMYLAAYKEKYLQVLPGEYIFTSTYDFFLELKKSFNDPKIDEYAVLSRYSSAAYLVLDDLGSTTSTDWNLSQLQILVNTRYEQLLPTVYTSNLSLDELSEATGDSRISSRIKRASLDVLHKE